MADAADVPEYEEEKPYWHRYQLNADPFSSNSEESYYPVAEWEKTLDLAHHLIHYSNVILCITGNKGCGKTTLKRQFLNQIDTDSLFVFEATASHVLTPDRLVSTLNKGFHLETKPLGNYLETLEAQVEELQHGEQTCVILFEDAHLLTDDTLTALAELIELQSEAQMRLHIMLFGEPQLQQRLDKLINAKHLPDTVYNIVIEPITQQQTTQYLEHRFRAVGLVGNFPLRDSQLNRIWRMSQGIPARINDACQQVILNRFKSNSLEKPLSPLAEFNSPDFSIVKFWRRRKLNILIGLFLFIALLAVSIYTHLHSKKQEEDKVFSVEHLKISTNAKAAVTHAFHEHLKAIKKPVDKLRNSVLPLMLSADKTSTFSVPSITQKILPHPQYHYHTPAEPVIDEAPDLPVVTPDKPEAEPVDAPAKTDPKKADTVKTTDTEAKKIKENPTDAKPTKSKTKTAAPAKVKAKKKPVKSKAKKKAPTKDNNVYNKDEKFLLSQPEKHYTLQLMASVDKKKLLKESKLILNKRKHPSYLFRYGPHWHVLTYGVYKTFKAAKAAEKTIPKTMRQRIKPWPRALHLIHSEIKRPR